MTERIDHVARARVLETNAWARGGVHGDALIRRPEERRDMIASAQVHATLALVEQQRIANLTALGQFRVGVDDLPHLRHLVIRPKNEYDIEAVPDIAAALGIEEVQS